MGKKVFFWVGLSVVFAIAAAIILILRLRSSKNTISISLDEQSGVDQVSQWIPSSNTLTYTNTIGNSSTFVFDKQLPYIVISKGVNGRTSDQMIFNRSSIEWQTAFCVGDSIVFDADDRNVLAAIRNMGPHQCGQFI